MRVARAASRWIVGAGAALTFLAALLSPVEMVDSDPAIALLAAQALIDHGTLSLDVYRDHPDCCAYDFDSDYRVKRLYGFRYYYALGPPILMAPAVWVANRLGYDMLRQEDEFAVQNLLSALACAVVFVLLYRLCRRYLGLAPSLVITSVSTFGSSLMSTLATGLWSTDLQLVFICLALLHLADREDRRPSYSYLLLLLALAFLCRPSAVIFGVAIVASRLRPSRRTALGVGVALALAIGLWLALHRVGIPDWLPRYYFYRRPAFDTAFVAMHGLLLSPSRGLLVFSPFLLPVLVTAIVKYRTLRESRVFRLALIWIGLLLAALAVKPMWWGGHSYGPRMVAELMPAFVLITALGWRGWARQGGSRARLAAVTYLVLAVPAIAIHSGQGLFNPAVRRWNESPNIDRYPQALFDWRFPQFLASESQIAERRLVLEPPRLAPYRLGARISHDDERVYFAGWYPPETDLRWTHGRESELLLRIDELDAARPHVLELSAGALGRQSFGLSVNGDPAAEFELDGLALQSLVLLLSPGRLAAGQNRIQLRIQHPASTENDPRELGLALRELRLTELESDLPRIGFADQGFMEEGFSEAESGWRWTAARRASVAYPVGRVDPNASYSLHLKAGALGRQVVRVSLNGRPIGNLEFAGFEPVAQSLRLPAGLLRPFRLQKIEFEIPGATRTATDSRVLGLALVELQVQRLVADSSSESS